MDSYKTNKYSLFRYFYFTPYLFFKYRVKQKNNIKNKDNTNFIYNWAIFTQFLKDDKTD